MPDGPVPDLTALPKPVTTPEIAVVQAPAPSEFLQQTRHLFVLPNYNETPQLLAHTLRVLMTHPNCQTRSLADPAGTPHPWGPWHPPRVSQGAKEAARSEG